MFTIIKAYKLKRIVLEVRYVRRISKGKASPVQAVEAGCEKLRLPHFLDSRLTDGDKVVSPRRLPRFTPRNIPGNHFC
jgi:hypothetical protein